MSGVLLALIASLFFAIGNVSQKKGMIELGSGAWQKLLLNKWWSFGMLLSCIAILSVYSITATHELSLIQPVLALNPLLSVFLARVWLKEKGSAKLYAALFFGFIGVLFLSRSPVLQGVVHSDGGLGFSLVGFALMLWLWLTRKSAFSFKLAILSGIGFGLATVLFKVFAVLFLKAEDDFLSTVSYLAKHWSVYAYIVAYCAGFFCSQIALRRGHAVLVVPLSAAVGAAVPVLGGVLLFSEQLDIYRLLCLLFIGISLLLFN